MLCNFYCEVTLLLHIEKLIPIDTRMIVPIIDSHLESTLFGIAQRIQKGVDRKIVTDGVALN